MKMMVMTLLPDVSAEYPSNNLKLIGDALATAAMFSYIGKLSMTNDTSAF